MWGLAQDYIDVEAERAIQPLPVEVITRGDGSVVSPLSTPINGPTATATDNTPVGVRPYSGKTTQANAIADAPAGEVNVGSLVVQLQLLQEDVRRLNGLVEEQAQQLARLKEQSLERYVDLDRRVAGLSSTPPTVTDKNPGAESFIEPTNIPVTSVNTAKEPGEEVAYQSAYQLVKARQFLEAVEAFKTFLGDYPFGYFAPNAHYWLGELYLVLDTPDPELARQSFQLLLDQYPNNAKVPDAIYKLGRVHFLKGNRDRARSYLSRVTSEYPNHPAAQLAQDFIRDNF